MSTTAASASWPGHRTVREITSSDGIAISHSVLESPTVNGVETCLPDDRISLCVHFGGPIWMRKRSSFTNFEREGGAGSATLSIGGDPQTIEYRTRRCEGVRFLMTRRWLDELLDDGARSHAVEFIDPQNQQDSQLAVLGQLALLRSRSKPGDRLLADSIGFAVAGTVLRCWSNRASPASPDAAASRDDRRMQRVRDYIEANLAAPLSLIDLARVSGLPIPYFMQLFKACFGMTPYRWIAARKTAGTGPWFGD